MAVFPGDREIMGLQMAILNTVLCEGDHERDGGSDPKLTEPVGRGCLGKWKTLSNFPSPCPSGRIEGLRLVFEVLMWDQRDPPRRFS